MRVFTSVTPTVYKQPWSDSKPSLQRSLSYPASQFLLHPTYSEARPCVFSPVCAHRHVTWTGRLLIRYTSSFSTANSNVKNCRKHERWVFGLTYWKLQVLTPALILFTFIFSQCSFSSSLRGRGKCFMGKIEGTIPWCKLETIILCSRTYRPPVLTCCILEGTENLSTHLVTSGEKIRSSE